ncbi:MAG: PepSY domain-containing protein [Pseudomonadota bacterium]
MRDPPQRRRFRSLYLWHRYLGLVAALLVVCLAVTGVLVQHAQYFGLQSNYAENQILLQWYGLTPNPVTSYPTPKHWLSHSGETIYLNNNPLEGKYTGLLGAVESGLLLIAITEDSVLLLTHEGDLVEDIGVEDGLPEPPQGIAYRKPQGVILQGRNVFWHPDHDWLNWHPYKGPSPEWSQPRTTPAALLAEIQQHNLSHELSWERVLLDLHSGRLLGEYGTFVMDLAALAMLLLAGSGTVIWLQRRPSKRLRRHKFKR